MVIIIICNKVLVTGCNGQLGIALQKIKPADVEMLALGRSQLDITNYKQVEDVVTRFKPDWIINAAAYTDVDKAESESVIAFLINRDGAENLARLAEVCGAKMVQVSTDYVFDGSQKRPYKIDDQVNPINVYGESKLGGEIAVRNILDNESLILRTSWLYASHGRNFLTTMLRLMKERRVLKVVEDQVSTPTNVFSLAAAIFSAIKNDVTGTHHWTDAGVASRYDFAIAINKYSVASGLIKNKCSIVAITTEEYPVSTKRPKRSVLDKSDFMRHTDIEEEQWRMVLKKTMS